ncbi:hypothetical protein DUI87_04047 [Hirundo rustica rustica]|uniref:Uncharacterized protein n=1 Tax=Hirundo rustica rustica TaxID=333673 RepID=A0A3M0L2U6_HIRRU|nr:hypothetical protein DUI87_04047 [Hirundo rustica rustica]
MDTEVNCTCRRDMVSISMDVFVRKFQPDRYQLWKQGKDLYTIDHTKPTPESTPETFYSDSSISYNSFQHTRSRSKKLKTPEDKRVSAVVADAEIIVAEAAIDGFKVSEAPEKKVRVVNTGVPSGEEENSSRIHLDQHVLDHVKVAGSIPSDSVLSPVPVLEKTKMEDEDRIDSNHSCFTLEDSVASKPASGSCRKEESLKSQNQCVSSVLYHKAEGQTPEAGNPDRKESISSEYGISNLESSGSTLEHGEMPIVKKDEEDSMEISCSEKVEKKKISKSWRHPLHKPPARSPMTLVKQQATSDEELPETTLIEEKVQESEAWARPLVYLWQTRPCNFNAEKEYNAACAKKEPHCAICTLLMPYYKPDNQDEESPTFSEANSAETLMAENERTRPLIPEMCFIYSEENTENCPSNAYVEEDGTSLLISCAKCCVVMVFLLMKSIMSGCVLDAEKKPGQLWAHVICAIAIPEVRFGNVTERTPIDTSRIPLQRLKLGEQPLLPQPLLTGLELQALALIYCTFLDMLEHLNILLGPQVSRCSLTSAEDRERILGLVLLAALLLVQARMPLAFLVTWSGHWQDLALAMVGPHATGFDPLIQPVQISLKNLPTLQQINTPTQLDVICKLTEGALDPLGQIIKILKRSGPDSWETPLATSCQLDLK